jgi:hypothetical protein
VAAAEADRLLDVIDARVATAQTGAAWQRATLAAAERGRSRDRALAVMFDRYLSCAATGQPVHTWPMTLAAGTRRQPGARRRLGPSQPGLQLGQQLVELQVREELRPTPRDQVPSAGSSR